MESEIEYLPWDQALFRAITNWCETNEISDNDLLDFYIAQSVILLAKTKCPTEHFKNIIRMMGKEYKRLLDEMDKV